MPLFLKVFIIGILFKFAQGNLDNILKSYELLEPGVFKRNIVKRGVDALSNSSYNRIEDIRFTAFSRTFRLSLTPVSGLLASNFEAVAISGNKVKEKVHVTPNEFYQGHVFGEMFSHVNAYIDEYGVLTASIKTSKETFIVEPAWRHIENADPGTSLIYKAADLRHQYEGHHETPRVCGFVQIDADTLVNASSASFKERFGVENEFVTHSRRKRHSTENNFNWNKNRCPIKLVADYRFYDKMGGGSQATTVRYLISLIDRVNSIYFDSIWRDTNVSHGITNMGFVIKKIVVHTSVSDEVDHYNSVKNDWDVGQLLQKFTEAEGTDPTQYCLVHLFTYQAFAGGVLGLGYIASPRVGSVGGICSAAAAQAGGKLVYYNSALSSLRSTYGSTVVTRQADIVTAHELGHNWGSAHDPASSECAPPSADGGSYIMYTYTVSGYDKNNNQLSPCSRRTIRAVLKAKSDMCFQETEKSFCGDRLVDENEECDEDFIVNDDNELSKCCTNLCKFKAGAVCSPKNSPCCTDDCKFMSAGRVCRQSDDNVCKESAYCDGLHADCPDSRPTKDNVTCLDEGECRNGECVSFCQKQGIDMMPCICENVTESCFRCCRPPNGTQCTPFIMEPNYPKAQVLSDGTVCIHGYCHDGKCKKDVQDFIEHIWNIIDKWDINFFMKFLHDNIVGTVIIVSLIFWVPASYWVHRIDLRKAEERRKELDFFAGASFASDGNRIEVVRGIQYVNYNPIGTAV